MLIEYKENAELRKWLFYQIMQQGEGGGRDFHQLWYNCGHLWQALCQTVVTCSRRRQLVEDADRHDTVCVHVCKGLGDERILKRPILQKPDSPGVG